MNLVLLPHHNTQTSLQTMQALLHERAPGNFLPSYPLVCIPAHTDDVEFQRGKVICKPMQALKEALKGADGMVRFGKLQCMPQEDGTRRIILPANIPFMKQIKEAGFSIADETYFTLGIQLNEDGDAGDSLTDDIASPEDARVFRLALMETVTLEKDCGKTFHDVLAWKYRLPFWVKLC